MGLWGRILEQSRPQDLILLGDNMYADHRGWTGFSPSDAENLQRQYQLLAQNIDFKLLVDSLGGIEKISATFDDHDYGINNGDSTFPLRNLSQTFFWDFLRVPMGSPIREQSGVYSSKLVDISENLTYKIILLDTRSNKSPTGTTPDGDFLGKEQWSWLERELADPRPEIMFVGSSIQVLPTDKVLEETWNEFPRARQRLLDLIVNAAAAPNIYLLSGDVHTGEVLQAKCRIADKYLETPFTEQFRLFEFTSSGLTHTFTKTTTELKKENADTVSASIGRSKGSFFELSYDMFVSTSVSNSREFKFLDHFRGLHYGLIEIDPGMLKILIIDEYGRTVLGRQLRLRQKGDWGLDGKKKVECQPFHGPAPIWRVALSKHSLWFLPLMFIGMPLAVVFLIIFSRPGWSKMKMS